MPPGCDGRVVASFGVNDTTVDEGTTQPRASAPDSGRHLARFLLEVRGAGWPVLVVGPPPISDPAQNERIASLDAMFLSICRDAGVGYDQLSADPVWLRLVAEGDGAHPGARGYQQLADVVWTWWLPWITAAKP